MSTLKFYGNIGQDHSLWHYQKVCEALIILLDNIYIRFGSKLYRHITGIPIGITVPLLQLICLYPWHTKYVKGYIVFVFSSVRPSVRECMRLSGVNIVRQVVCLYF